MRKRNLFPFAASSDNSLEAANGLHVRVSTFVCVAWSIEILVSMHEMAGVHHLVENFILVVMAR
jgi:hypothetical protein